MEMSSCGEECRRTANFYEALRCYEVLGLASVEWIPRLSGSKPSYTIIYYKILPHPLPSPPYRQHTKKPRFTKTLCSQYYGKTKQTCRNVSIWSSGVCNGWPVSRHQPQDTKLLPAEVLIVLAKSDRISRYPFRRQTVESNSLWRGFHFKDEVSCRLINSGLVAQWESMWTNAEGAKSRLAPIKHSSGMPLRLNCNLFFSKRSNMYVHLYRHVGGPF